jgi:hypothetical protein
MATHLSAVRARARELAPGVVIVPAPEGSPKKYAAVFPGVRRPVYFGARGYSDFVAHRDERRRAAYRARAEGARLADGTRAIDRYGSPAWLSYYLLW